MNEKKITYYTITLFFIASVVIHRLITNNQYNYIFLIYIGIITSNIFIIWNTPKALNVIRKSRVIKAVNVFLVYLTIHYLIAIIKGTPQITFIYLSQAVWISCANIFYVIGINNTHWRETFEKKIAYVCFLLVCCIFIRQINLSSNPLILLTEASLVSEFVNRNPYILAVLTIPLYFLKNKKIMAMAMLLIFGGILITGKRGPLLSVVAALIFVAILQKGIAKKIKILIFIFITAIIIVILINQVYPEALIYLSERLIEDETESMGSGRIGAWTKGYSIWSQLGIFTNLFGMGAGTINALMEKAWGLSVGAHSDYFDILFQYGYIGLFFQFYYCFNIAYIVLHIKNSEYANQLKYIGFFIIITMAYTMTYSTPMSLLYGSFFFYALGRIKREKQLLKEKNIQKECFIKRS